MDSSRGGAGLRHSGQSVHASGDGCVVVLPGPPTLGIRLPADLCGLFELDRTLVEDVALPGVQGTAFRDLGAGL